MIEVSVGQPNGFYLPILIMGGFGEVYLSHQGDRAPIPEANIDR